MHVVHDRRDWNPLGRATDEPLTLGLTAARAAAAIRHATSTGVVDEVDTKALLGVSGVLTGMVDALKFIEAGDAPGQVLETSFATMTTLEVLSDVDLTKVDAQHLGGFLEDFVARLAEFMSAPANRALAASLLPFLNALAEAAMRRAGTTGEVSTAL